MRRLREIAEAATPGPWEQGDVWSRAGVINADGTCAYCERMGAPVWTGTDDINGEQMLAHKHRDPDPWRSEHLVSAPSGLVAGNFDYEEGGLIAEADTEFVATFDPETVLALLDVAEAASLAVRHLERFPGDDGDEAVARFHDALARLREVSDAR